MLKKAKKSRRSATSCTTSAAAAARSVQNDASPCSSRVHPCIFLNTDSGALIHERRTSNGSHSVCTNDGGDDDDEESDAFL